MIALTRDFHVFTSRVTTDFSAVFFSVRYVAQARYVRAFLALLIRHFGSGLSGRLCDPCSTAILDVAPFNRPSYVSLMGLTLRCQSLVATVTSTNCIRVSKPTWPLPRGFARVLRSVVKRH